MTKPDSGLFKGTSGIEDFYGDAERVIAERVKGLDLREHPLQEKQLSNKQRDKILDKINSRTATRDEYKRFLWDQRFSKRRNRAIRRFWTQEKERILLGLKPTRPWSDEQVKDIMNNRTPKFNEVALQGHHTYSASKFPQLADLGEIIYPATKEEHLKGWHGGNYKKSLPGRRIRRIRQF